MVSALLAAAPTVPTVSSGELTALLIVVVGGAIVAGLIVILARHTVSSGADEPAGSVVRSWLAISLVFGLLAYCAASFRIADSSLRSTLFGGLIASVGAAVAFYFSSKSADQARSDILKTALAISQGGTAPTAFSAALPPAGAMNAAYPGYHFVADGSPTPTYLVGSGALPDGLTLDIDGTLHGIPTKADDFTFSVLAWNPAGAIVSSDIIITVRP
jgi:hypothetical protein